MSKLFENIEKNDENNVLDIIKNSKHLLTEKHFGLTPLLFASKFKNCTIIKALIEAGAHVNDIDPESKTTSLHYSARYGTAEIVTTLIEAGANIHAKNNYGNTPLHNAVEANNNEVIRALINAKSNLDEKNIKGETPLHYSALYGTVETVVTLINAGANIEAETKTGITPIQYSQDISIMNIFLNENASIKIEYHAGFLKDAITRFGSAELIKKLIDKGLDINSIDRLGRTPISYAVSSGNNEFVKIILDNGGKSGIEIRDKRFGFNPLHYDVHHVRPEIIKTLIQAGTELNATCYYEGTALSLASSDEIRNLLIKENADVSLALETTIKDNNLTKFIRLMPHSRTAYPNLKINTKNRTSKYLKNQYEITIDSAYKYQYDNDFFATENKVTINGANALFNINPTEKAKTMLKMKAGIIDSGAKDAYTSTLDILSKFKNSEAVGKIISFVGWFDDSADLSKIILSKRSISSNQLKLEMINITGKLEIENKSDSSFRTDLINESSCKY